MTQILPFRYVRTFQLRRSALCTDNEMESECSFQWTFQSCHRVEIFVHILCVILFIYLFVLFGIGGCAVPFKLKCESFWGETREQGRFVFQLHAPVDGWASRLGLPCETSPVVAQNALVRNKSFSFLFWASVSCALRHVLKCVEYICHTGAERWHFLIKLQSALWLRRILPL